MQHQNNPLATVPAAAIDPRDAESRRYLGILEGLSRIISPTTFAFSIIYILAGHVEKGVLGLLIAGIFALPLLCVRFGRVWLAKVLFFGQFIAISLLLAWVIGRDACTEWIVVLAPALAFLLFPRRVKWIYLPFGIIAYIGIKAIYHFHEPLLVSNYPELYRVFLATIIAAFLYWLVVIFENEATASEKTIRSQRDELLAVQDKLEAQNSALKLLNGELQQFAHHASHDMREPLRTISSFSTLLSRRLRDQPEEKELLKFIEDGSKRMAKMLEDLIEYARAGMEEAQREPVPLAEILKNVQKSLGFRLENSGATIEASILPTVSGHATLLTQLFQNLIGNSLKYHRPEVPPRIDIHFFMKDGRALLVFRDNGLGMEGQYLKQIFEPFRRLHGQGEYEGSGIGLATCRKIVELYGGKIWAESEFGAGSSFFIEWPGEMVVDLQSAVVVPILQSPPPNFPMKTAIFPAVRLL